MIYCCGYRKFFRFFYPNNVKHKKYIWDSVNLLKNRTIFIVINIYNYYKKVVRVLSVLKQITKTNNQKNRVKPKRF